MINIKGTIYTLALALLTLLTACSPTVEESILYEEDAQAVHLSTSLGSVTTRALTRSAEYPAKGTLLYLSEDLGRNYYAYQAADENGHLVPVDADSYLRWKSSAETHKELLVSSPTANASAFTLPTDQSSGERLTAADWLTFSGTVTRGAQWSSQQNDLSFTLNHRLSRVEVQLTSVADQYSGCTFVLTFHSAASVSLKESEEGVTVQAGTKETTLMPYQEGETYLAVLAPNESSESATFLEIQPMKGGEKFGKTLVLQGRPELLSGYGYTFHLSLLDDAIRLNQVNCCDWIETSPLEGGKAREGNWFTIDLSLYSSAAEARTALTDAMNAGYDCIKYIGTSQGDMNSLNIFRETSSKSFPTLTRVDLSEVSGLDALAAYTFRSGTTLVEAQLPATATSIGNDLFSGCTSLTSAEIPEGIKVLAAGAFSMCTSLTKVTLHEGLTTLGSAAFCLCTSLQTLHIPTSVTTITGNGHFYYCSALQSLTLPGVTALLGESENLSFITGDYQTHTAALRQLILPKATSIGEGLVDDMSTDIIEQLEMVLNVNAAKNRVSGNVYKNYLTTVAYTNLNSFTPKSITLVNDDGTVYSSTRSDIEVGKPYTDYFTE